MTLEFKEFNTPTVLLFQITACRDKVYIEKGAVNEITVENQLG